MTLREILVWAPAAVVFFAAIEALILRFAMRQDYNWRASLASLCDFMTRQYVVSVLITVSIATPLTALAYAYRLGDIPLSTPAAIAVLFVGQEFCYYWFHRASHRIRWFWATHAVHHSPNELNLSASYRFGITGPLNGSRLFFVPLIWVGFDPAAVFLTLTLNLLYQFWLHTTWIPKLGWFEYVFNTPSHHRVHHASNPEYIDANYGGVLIVFDRLFGTFVAERDDVPCRYGLVKPLISNNPLYIAFHEWIALVRDLIRARNWRERWHALFGAPGQALRPAPESRYSPAE